MRIALLAPLVTPIAEPFVGGSQAMVAYLARGLMQRGHEVTLFAREGSFVPDVHIETIPLPESVRPARFSDPGQEQPADPGFFAQANCFLNLFLDLQRRSHEFDLLHSHAFDWPAFVLSPLLRSLPVIHTLHLPAVVPEINEGLRILHQQGHPITLVTVSQACADSFALYTPCDAVIYNGLDLDAIPFNDHVPAEAPLLFAGRITPEKGVVTAIEVARRTRTPLLLAGGVYDQRYFDEEVQPAIQATEGLVRYLGQLSHQDLWQLMSQVRALLFPIAWDEPFGLTPVEAMAAGTPVLAYKRGAVAEVIHDEMTGFVVPADDLDALLECVSRISTLSRQHCRQHVLARFSFSQMLIEHERLYGSVVRRFQTEQQFI